MPSEPEQLRIAVGSDDAGRTYKDLLAEALRADGRVAEVRDVADGFAAGAAYPLVALAAAEQVADGLADRALLVCHTGLGMAIAANKVPGIRAVTAHDVVSVRASVLSNDAQVLALGQGVIGLALARRLVDEWLTHRFAPGTSATAKLAAIRDYEENRASGAVAGRGC
ncbi:RpiB/LacA/LacB family sugar-phosphate isomerase [Streptomyces sp. NPDC001744]|uniref:RpiB/LacA/LacB family sugar-phosphate isomerase n=1 Tax=Streptomyces sp. NPDC001744 TaxID=3364606 RepID=UPI0036C2D686